MSATFRHAKQKPTQQELRRLMTEQKNNQHKTANASGAGGTKRIDSPLAKYNDLGQLQCVLCKTVVRSDDVWKVHINAKQHKQNIELAKQLKLQTNNFTSAAAAVKRPASVSTAVSAEIPEKRIRGILKNSAAVSSPAIVDANPNSSVGPPEKTTKSAIPSDFFDAPASGQQAQLSFYAATMQKTSIRQDLLSINRESLQPTDGTAKAPDDDATAAGGTTSAADEPLPEGFFDDPVKDAKARNLEYKDPVEEEWDRFQKEIKAAADTSNAIMAEDQVEATTERQIDEIDEQIRNWSR